MEQYDIAMGNKIQKEFQADFQSKNKVIKCVSEFPWERQFQAAYTNSIFTLVQEQVKHTMYCHVMPQNEDDQASQDSNPDVHIEKIKVLERSGYPHMTEEYKKYQIIEKQSQHCADLAMGSIEKMEFIEQQCNAMKSALLNWNPTTTTNIEGPSVRVPQSPVVEGGPILNPNVTRTVGRPRDN
ncbi:hypothetical protein ACS0TY_008071 [Phlomoides rotata]